LIEYGVARAEHLPGILSLYRQLVPDEEPLDINEAEKIFEQGGQQGVRYFVALDGGRVVASCYIAVIPNMTRGGKSNGFIENVITDEQYRKQGIGKKLIEAAVQYGKENNCYKIVLLSGAKRPEAHLFYERCGFDGNSKRGFELRF
jgi:GNAT superfamily N-acetyltransferase